MLTDEQKERSWLDTPASKHKGIMVDLLKDGFYAGMEAGAKLACEWISVDERIPTEEDADCFNSVWGRLETGYITTYTWNNPAWKEKRYRQFTHWARTGFVTPPQPEEV